MTRGLYLNNPACIRLSSLNRWRGLSKIQKDKEFCTFDSVVYGVRALIITLRTYYYRHNLTNVRSIISRYAPSSENDTESYIHYISDRVLFSDNLILFDSWNHPTFQCFQLCRAICLMESGFYLERFDFDESVSIL